MKTSLTLLMPLLSIISFTISSKLFAEANYFGSAFSYLTCFSITSLWIAMISTKSPFFRH
jgi:hypothetical protein